MVELSTHMWALTAILTVLSTFRPSVVINSFVEAIHTSFFHRGVLLTLNDVPDVSIVRLVLQYRVLD